MKIKAIEDDGTEIELIRCNHCQGGTWYTECCNGSTGCDCRGQEINMGPCRVCEGSGWRREDANTRANCDMIQGMSYIGSGPRYS